MSGKQKLASVISWLIVIWICYIFLGSLPYKFSNHPDTQHIFSTIGQWLGGFAGNGIGELFSSFGAYAVGSAELLVSLLLLSPLIYWIRNRSQDGAIANTVRATRHAIGGLLASMVMSGAVFFHLFTPLGIEVLHNGVSDGGSLFRAAVSILVLGVVLFSLNFSQGFRSEK